jgi:IclR family transcriptional regulator, pca regulon regulatory protein
MLATAEEIAAWPSGSDQFVEAFAKGLALIGAFGGQPQPLSITDLSKRTGLPRAGVRRLLLTLVTLGLAEEREHGFALTPRVLRLGYAYLSSLSLREIAQPAIEALARDCQEVVAVSMLDGAEITYIARAEPSSVLRRSLTVGSRLPAYCTSMGRVLLAGLADAQLDALLATATPTPLTRHTITAPRALRRAVLQVRKDGWALVSEELELGTCGIAAPIRDHAGRTIAALNISTNLARHSEKGFVREFKAPLLALAERISASLPPA